MLGGVRTDSPLPYKSTARQNGRLSRVANFATLRPNHLRYFGAPRNVIGNLAIDKQKQGLTALLLLFLRPQQIRLR